MEKALDHILDAIDIETYLICRSESEGKSLARKLGDELNLPGIDIMFEEFDGCGMRVRLRKYIHKPSQNYKWLGAEDE
jgi:hypothetical protein